MFEETLVLYQESPTTHVILEWRARFGFGYQKNTCGVIIIDEAQNSGKSCEVVK